MLCPDMIDKQQQSCDRTFSVGSNKPGARGGKLLLNLSKQHVCLFFVFFDSWFCNPIYLQLNLIIDYSHRKELCKAVLLSL